MTSRVYALANQKGGVGKTTTAINMAACVAEAGTPVLLIDLDPQANATTGLGYRPDDLEGSSYDLLHGRPLDEVLVETDVDNLWLVPSHPDLAAAQVELSQNDTLLRDLLADTGERFPYVFVDCPPSLGLLTVNALSAANRLIVPVQCEYYALEGLAQLLQSVELVRTRLNPRLGVTGVLLDDVRRPDAPVQRRRDRGARALRQPGLRHRRPAQRAPGRGSQPRAADHAVRFPQRGG